MGVFDSHADSPDQIRIEGEEITLKFERTGPTTGTISWNIPSPAQGCDADHQAYCGIVVVLNNIPNKPVQTWPQDGTRYVGDPTGDPDLHAGDTIGGALVVGAFYEDKTTTSIQLTGLSENETYFATGHATTCGLTYHRQGVSSYSLPYVYTQPTPDTSAYQEIIINESGGGVEGTDTTGLDVGTDYTFNLRIDGTPYEITINGTDAQTYQDLLDAINKQIKLLHNPPQSPTPPNTGAYYYNVNGANLYQWNGFEHVEIPVITESDAPNNVSVGEFWLDSNGLLFKREFVGSPPGAGSPRATEWVQQTVIASGVDPAAPACDSFWHDLDDNTTYSWDGSVWCQRPTIEQSTDPSCPPTLACGTYWYDETNEMLFQWDEETNTWTQVDAILWDVDPTAPAIGTLWLNDSTNQLFRRAGGSPSWLEQTVTINEEAPSLPSSGDYWFQPSTQELFIFTNGSPQWQSVDLLIWSTDPTQPQSCDLWWNISTDELFIRDVVGNDWNSVVSFFIQPTDPSAAIAIEIGTIWVDDTNPLDLVFWEWDGSQFVLIDANKVIQDQTNPVTTTVVGTIWFNTIASEYLIRTSPTTWGSITPIKSVTDPSMPSIGDFWFNTSNNTLNNWNGMTWVNVAFSTMPITPATGSLWFNSTEMELYEWNGITYVVATPKAVATGNDGIGCSPQGNIVIASTGEGSDSSILIGEAIINSDVTTFTVSSYRFVGDLFESLSVPATLNPPVEGTDGLSGIPMYDEVGVGTNGDPAARRELMDSMRRQLGYPVVEVELDNYQMNEAIQSALEELRERSSAAYRRVFFFLNVKRGQAKYQLTNKTVDYHTIVNILGVHRITSAFLSTTQAAGVYGQTVLQHLYHMGTYDLVSYHLVSDYIEQLEQMFATRITYTWNEAKRELHMFQQFVRDERVLIDAIVERTEQELMTDRYTKTWIERWALAQARLMLAEIRGKYATLPGAGGGVALNAGDLQARADIDMQQCIADLDNFVVNDVENLGIGSEIIIG